MRQSKNQNDDFRWEHYENNKEEIVNRHKSISNQNNTQTQIKGVVRGIEVEIHDPNLPASHKKTRREYKNIVEEKIKNSEGRFDSCEGKFPSYRKWDTNGNLLEERFHKDGKVHSFDDKPACIKLSVEGEIIQENWKNNGNWKQREYQQPNRIVYENGKIKNHWKDIKGNELPTPKSFAADKESKQLEITFNNQTASTGLVPHAPLNDLIKIEIDTIVKMLEHFKTTGDPAAFYKSVKYMSSIGSDAGLYSGEHTTPFNQPSLH